MNKNILVINIGGISNYTLLSKDKLFSSDIGPGNVLIDSLCKRYFKKNFDDKGQLAKNGKVDLTTELFSVDGKQRYFIKERSEIDQIKIPGSNESLSSVSASSDIILTVPRTKNKSLDFSIELDSQISFPVAAGTKIGQLKVNIPNETSEYFDIYSTNELKRTNIFSRFFSYIYQSIVNLFV